MHKLAIIFTFFIFLLYNVYPMQVNFNPKDLDINSFLNSCLKQVKDNVDKDKKTNEIKFRFLDERTSKDFFITFDYGSNRTDDSPNRHLAINFNNLFQEIINKNFLIISDNSLLINSYFKQFPVVAYSRFVGNLFKLIRSYKPDFIFFIVQDDLYDINEYCKYSNDIYCQKLWLVFSKDEIPDNSVSNLNVKKIKIIINPNKIVEQICTTVNTAVNYIFGSKEKVLNFTENSINFALSQFSSFFPDLNYEFDKFDIGGSIITGMSNFYDKMNEFIVDFLNNKNDNYRKDFIGNKNHNKDKNDFFNNFFSGKTQRSMAIDCSGNGVNNPNNENECITGPREFTASIKFRKVDDAIIYICYVFAGITALLCLISGVIFFLIRNKKGFQYQDWKMTECIIIGLLLEVSPIIYVLDRLNDYKYDNSLIPMELLYLVYEMTIGGFYLPVYRVYKRVRLSQRYENLKRKARMLMDDEKDGQNSPSSHSMKGSARDQVIPINSNRQQNQQQPDSENSSSNKESEGNNNNNNIVIPVLANNQSSSTTVGGGVGNNNSQMPSSMSHASGMPRAPGQMLGGMPRPIIDLVAVGDSDSNKLRRGEWFEYLCWVFLALIVCILGIVIQPTKSKTVFDSIEVTTNELFNNDTQTWNVQHYYYIWNVEVKLNGVFIYIIFGLCILHSLVMIFMCLYMVRYGDNLNPYEYSILSSYYLLLSAWAGIIATVIRFSDSSVISVMVMTIYVCAYAILCLYVMFYPTIKYMSHKPTGGNGGGMKCQECGFDLKPPDINGNDLNSEVAQFEEEPEGGAQQPRKSVIRSFFNKLSMRPGQYNRSMIMNAASSRSVAPRSVIE